MMLDTPYRPLMDLHSAPEFDPRWTAASGDAASPHEVRRPFGALGNGKRPTPDLPHPAALRLQAFSASWRFVPPESAPALFHAGGTLGVLPSEVCSSRDADTASRQVFPSWRCLTQFAEANPKPPSMGCPTGLVPYSGGQSRRAPDTLAPCLPRPSMATDRTCLVEHCCASDRICPGGRKSLRLCDRAASTADRERPGELCPPCPAASVTVHHHPPERGWEQRTAPNPRPPVVVTETQVAGLGVLQVAEPI
jgi:hypothetical protein